MAYIRKKRMGKISIINIMFFLNRDKKKNTVYSPDEIKKDLESYKEAGKILRKQREMRGLTIEALSIRTKISSYVIKSIEGGNLEKLPEHTYLRAMLYSLEKTLGLENGTLKDIISKNVNKPKRNQLTIFTIGRLGTLTNWKSSFIYILLIFSSIFIINKQQKYLSTINSQTIEPIQPLNIIIKTKDIDSYKTK